MIEEPVHPLSNAIRGYVGRFLPPGEDYEAAVADAMRMAKSSHDPTTVARAARAALSLRTRPSQTDEVAALRWHFGLTSEAAESLWDQRLSSQGSAASWTAKAPPREASDSLDPPPVTNVHSPDVAQPDDVTRSNDLTELVGMFDAPLVAEREAPQDLPEALPDALPEASKAIADESEDPKPPRRGRLRLLLVQVLIVATIVAGAVLFVVLPNNSSEFAILSSRTTAELIDGQPGPATSTFTVDQRVYLWIEFTPGRGVESIEIRLVYEGDQVLETDISLPRSNSRLPIPLPASLTDEPGEYSVTVRVDKQEILSRTFEVSSRAR